LKKRNNLLLVLIQLAANFLQHGHLDCALRVADRRNVFAGDPFFA
jgi:hypothetical protein